MAYATILSGEAPSVLNSVNDFLKNNIQEDALEITYRFIASKKKTNWSHEYEKLMLLNIELGVTLNKQDYITENLINFRNVSQGQIGSMETVFSSYVNIIEEQLAKNMPSKEDFDKIIEEINIQDDPQMFYYNTLNTDKGKNKEKVKSLWRMLTIAYKTILDLTNRNIKLENIYSTFAKNILQKLFDTKAINDFKYFCSLLKNHQASLHENIASNSSNLYKDLTMFDSSKKLYDLRKFQFDLCKKNNLNQEAFLILEDVHILLTSCKYPVEYFIEYYQNLANIFFKGGFMFFHALALSQYFLYLQKSKTIKNLSEVVTKLVLATLSINSSSEEHLLSGPMLEKYERLLGTRKTIIELFAELENLIGMFCTKEIKELFEIFVGKTDIYTFAEDIDKIFKSIDEKYSKYSTTIKENCILTVLKLLANFFSNINFHDLSEFTSFMDFEKVKRIILINKFDKSLNLSIDYDNKMLHFNNNSLKTDTVLESYEAYLEKLSHLRFSLKLKSKTNGETAEEYILKTKSAVLDVYQNSAKFRKDVEELINKEKDYFTEQKPVEIKKLEESEALVQYQKERIQKMRLAEMVDQKILEHKKEKVHKILSALPNVMILNKKLSLFTDTEINQLELDILAEFEKATKDKKKKADVQSLKQHYREFHFYQRELYKVFVQRESEESVQDNENAAKFVDELIKGKQKKLEVKNAVQSASAFVNKFKKNIEDQQKEFYRSDCIKFQNEVTDHYRSSIMEDAKQKYIGSIQVQEKQEKASKLKQNQMGGRNLINNSGQAQNQGSTQQPSKDVGKPKDFGTKDSGMSFKRGENFVGRKDTEVSKPEEVVMSRRGENFQQKSEAQIKKDSEINFPAQSITLERGTNRAPIDQGLFKKPVEVKPEIGMAKRGEGIKGPSLNQNPVSMTNSKNTKEEKPVQQLERRRAN